MKKLIFILSLLLSHVAISQRLFHQDVFHGGVTVGGLNSSGGIVEDSFNLFIEPGSTIRKAYLFTLWAGSKSDFSISIEINSQEFRLYQEDLISSAISEHPSFGKEISYYCLDVTDYIDPSVLEYEMKLQGGTGELDYGAKSGTLYIEYENNSLPKVGSSIFINNQIVDGSVDLCMENMLKIDNTSPIGNSIYVTHTSNYSSDATNIYLEVNSDDVHIGKIWGADIETSYFSGTGTKGMFYYQNNELFGLSDDFPNNTVDSTDAIFDMSSYVENLITGYKMSLTYESYPLVGWNIPMYIFNAYTTPCDTFSISLTQDTVLCKGDSIQLQATGNTNYAWLYGDNISDTSVANPWVKPDSNQLYTVLISDGAGCGKTANVIVKVNETPTIETLEITETLCGEPNGVIEITEISNEEEGYFYSINGTAQNSPIFNNLNGENYTMSITNPTGCSFDTIVTIPVTQNVVADFYASPENGYAPLDIQLTNTSENTNTHVWDLGNGTTSTSEHPFTTYDTSGTYQVALISYYNETACADTAYATIYVYDAMKAIVPNVFSPNNDFANDMFTIKVDGAFQITGTIKNRWGNTMNAFDKTLDGTFQTIELWNGENANPGVYFYEVLLEDVTGKEQVFQGHLTLRK